MAEEGRISAAVALSIESASLKPSDSGAIELAYLYADLIDESEGTMREFEVVKDLGPKLLATLTALGLTLTGRATPQQSKGGTDGQPSASAAVTALDELRARRSRTARAN